MYSIYIYIYVNIPICCLKYISYYYQCGEPICYLMFVETVQQVCLIVHSLKDLNILFNSNIHAFLNIRFNLKYKYFVT